MPRKNAARTRRPTYSMYHSKHSGIILMAPSFNGEGSALQFQRIGSFDETPPKLNQVIDILRWVRHKKQSAGSGMH